MPCHDALTSAAASKACTADTESDFKDLINNRGKRKNEEVYRLCTTFGSEGSARCDLHTSVSSDHAPLVLLLFAVVYGLCFAGENQGFTARRLLSCTAFAAGRGTTAGPN